MKKSLMLSLAILAVVTIFAACGGEKKPAETKPQTQAIPPMGKPVVEVPEAVKGKWKAVVLSVENKETKKVTEETVALGEKYKLPGSDLSILVSDFFPSFVMQGSKITSISNEANNPAAQIVVSEGGTEVFHGWLFGRYPTTHAFALRYERVLRDRNSTRLGFFPLWQLHRQDAVMIGGCDFGMIRGLRQLERSHE